MLQSILTGPWSDQCDGETTIITRDPISSEGDVLGTNNSDEAGLLFARNVQQTLSQEEAAALVEKYKEELSQYKKEYADVKARADEEAAACAAEQDDIRESLTAITNALEILKSSSGGAA